MLRLRQAIFIVATIAAASFTTACGSYYADLYTVGPGVYAVSGYDGVYYADDYYWRYNDGYWYRSPYYDRGWAVATPPAAVLRYGYPYRYGYYPYRYGGYRHYPYYGYRYPSTRYGYRYPAYRHGPDRVHTDVRSRTYDRPYRAYPRGTTAPRAYRTPHSGSVRTVPRSR